MKGVGAWVQGCGKGFPRVSHADRDTDERGAGPIPESFLSAAEAHGAEHGQRGHTRVQDGGQLALANITNAQGLQIAAGNNYQTTLASGQASIGVAGSAGLGTIEDEALESSNVDISTQFADLIVAQQAFQASSKAITTFDTISQDTINMIR